MGVFVDIRNVLFGALYRGVIKPLLFLRDPEDVHDGAVTLGKLFGRFALTRALTRVCFGYSHPMLSQTIHGVGFLNPVGLAAGFDKDGHLVEVLGALGFGAEEVGSVTGEACAGNPRPRLWRLPHTQALGVYYGLKNDGAEVVAARIARAKKSTTIGISVAKTNSPGTASDDAGIADYTKAFRAALPVADFITINISCPNAYGGEPFHDSMRLAKLLSRMPLADARQPLFIKVSPDLSTGELDALLDVIKKHPIAGIVVGNLTKNREALNIDPRDTVPEKGGISGIPTKEKALALVRHARRAMPKEFTIIGCGGIMSADDAYAYIRAGASLVQLITGMIFEGPQLISDINRGLVRRLKRDGFPHLSDAVGTPS